MYLQPLVKADLSGVSVLYMLATEHKGAYHLRPERPYEDAKRSTREQEETPDIGKYVEGPVAERDPSRTSCATRGPSYGRVLTHAAWHNAYPSDGLATHLGRAAHGRGLAGSRRFMKGCRHDPPTARAGSRPHDVVACIDKENLAGNGTGKRAA